MHLDFIILFRDIGSARSGCKGNYSALHQISQLVCSENIQQCRQFNISPLGKEKSFLSIELPHLGGDILGTLQPHMRIGHQMGFSITFSWGYYGRHLILNNLYNRKTRLQGAYRIF